jgi:hypothetical protein
MNTIEPSTTKTAMSVPERTVHGDALEEESEAIQRVDKLAQNIATGSLSEEVLSLGLSTSACLACQAVANSAS